MTEKEAKRTKLEEDRTAAVLELAQVWLKYDKNNDTRSAIETLVKNGDIEQLRNRLEKRISFGTAGLRGEMKEGFANMNDLIIVQTTQGLCQYLISKGLSSKGVVIGHDHRHNSLRFAQLAAGVFLSNNIKVYYFFQNVHTPLVPFTILNVQAGCGIMITASHNPKQDNGYKLYWENGAQINSPIDEEISSSIMKNLEPKVWDATLVNSSELCIDPIKSFDVVTKYFKSIKDLCTKSEENKKSNVKFVYTAMHGVGYPFAVEAMKQFNLSPFVSVKEQQVPDPNFSTVKFPNPEEGKDSLDLAIKTADEQGAQVILANDPDADRFSATEKTKNGWRIITGNEIGTLLASYVFETCKAKGNNNSKFAMLRSAVSSTMIDHICKKEGVFVQETLTGFKWIGNKAIDLEKEGYQVIFAYEEAIGFMVNPHVKDKDGVSTLAVFAEMTNELYGKGITLSQQIDQLYQKYGYFVSDNSYFICYDSETKVKIFDEMRTTSSGERKYPDKVGDFVVSSVRDLQVGFDSEFQDKKPILPFSQSNLMITFRFENGTVATIRTSGTEPKIKYYIEHHGKFENKEQVDKELEKISTAITTHLIQPEKFKLQSRTTK